MTDPKKLKAFEDALDEYRRVSVRARKPPGVLDAARDHVLRLYEEAVKDAARLDWAQEHYIGADFDYGAEPNESHSVLLIEIPRAVSVGNDLRRSLDAAMATDAPITEDGK